MVGSLLGQHEGVYWSQAQMCLVLSPLRLSSIAAFLSHSVSLPTLSTFGEKKQTWSMKESHFYFE